MREASYNTILSRKIEEEIGGRCIKLSDRVTLGLPDTLHILGGIVTFIEVKIGNYFIERDDKYVIQPWGVVNDLRQYEFCRNISRHSLTMYVIYYPEIKMTAVLTMAAMELFNPNRGVKPHIELQTGEDFVQGHGIELINEIMHSKRREIRDKLNTKL